MSIQCTMTEADVQAIAHKIKMPLSWDRAAEVLQAAETKLNEDHRRGGVRIFESAVIRVLRKEP